MSTVIDNTTNTVLVTTPVKKKTTSNPYDNTKPRVFTKSTCPLCPRTYSRSFKLPGHLLKHHCADVFISEGSRPSHYIPAYIKQKGRIPDIDFCVCLTCHKGFMGDDMTPRGSRWVNEHVRKNECVTAHSVALTTFKKCHTLAIEERVKQETKIVATAVSETVSSEPVSSELVSSETVSSEPVSSESIANVSPQETATSDTKTPFHIVWEFIKRKYPVACGKIEDEAAELVEDDSDADEFVFNPKEGLLDVMNSMCGYKKQFEKLSLASQTDLDKKDYIIAQRDGRIAILEQNLKDAAKRFREEVSFTDSE